MDPLLASLMFVFDFTCILPFNVDNGRMPRLLTLPLPYKAGHLVGKYVSAEKEIERTKNAYYDAFAASSVDRHENSSNVRPFARYMPGVILAAYRELEERMSLVSETKFTKAERVEAVLHNSFGKVTKRYASQTCPDINTATIERAPADLLASEKVKKVGSGPQPGTPRSAIPSSRKASRKKEATTPPRYPFFCPNRPVALPKRSSRPRSLPIEDIFIDVTFVFEYYRAIVLIDSKTVDASALDTGAVVKQNGVLARQESHPEECFHILLDEPLLLALQTHSTQRNRLDFGLQSKKNDIAHRTAHQTDRRVTAGSTSENALHAT